MAILSKLMYLINPEKEYVIHSPWHNMNGGFAKMLFSWDRNE